MKQELPMPLVIGVVAVLLIVAVVFFMRKGVGSNSGYDKDAIMRLQQQHAGQPNQGHSSTNGH